MMQRFLLSLITIATCLPLQAQQDDYYGRVGRGIESFGAVFREITTNYVDQTDPETIIRAGLRGMLAELDPYSEYMVGDETDAIDRLSSGFYVGFGFTIGTRNELLTITDVRQGHPAHNAGIRPGDVLISVDGHRVDSLRPDSLRQFTRGSLGTSAVLRLSRLGRADTVGYYLARAKIPVENIELAERLPGDIGYIKLARFSRTSGQDLRQALVRLTIKGDLSAIILDLRDNPGGLLDAAVAVCEIFLPSGSQIVSTKNRNNQHRDYVSVQNPLAPSTPLAILINERSASASEIVAGAMQDYDRAVIIGKRSFGKGLVQTVTPLPNDISLKITTARYYTPSGRSIQRNIRTDHSQPATGSFVTRNGRLVQPSSGINPDTSIADDAYPEPVGRLISSGVISDFATQYASAYAFLPPGFEADNELMSSFYTYTEGVEARRKSETLEKIDAAKNIGVDSDMSRTTIAAIDQAGRQVERELMLSLKRQSSLVKTLIDAEIRFRFTSDSERQRLLLHADPTINAAVALLTPLRYRALLSGDSGSDQ